MTVFSDKSLDKAIAKESRHRADVGLEAAPGERPQLTVEAQGEHDGERVDLTWGAYLRTQFEKAKTTVGGKFGMRW